MCPEFWVHISSIGGFSVFQYIYPIISALFSKSFGGNIGICAFFTQLAPISRLVIGGFLDNVKKSPNLFQHGYLQLENFSGKLKIPPTYHRKPVKQSNKKS